MIKYCWLVIAAACTAMPARAADWRPQPSEVRPGMFVGARLHLPFRGRAARPAGAALTLAPTATRHWTNGSRTTGFGEGIALSLSPREPVRLNVGGVPAGVAIGLRPAGEAAHQERKLGISSGGWAVIGAGVVVAAVAILVVRDKIDDSSD
ncbi:MAG TPA: hypothetical protein VGD23_02070 [Sphingomicrobium sp.]